MVYAPDIEAVAPALELTIDDGRRVGALRCAGRLDARTAPYLLQALTTSLLRRPAMVRIDIRELHVADGAGADALAEVQRRTQEAGVALRWRGLTDEHLRGGLALRYRAKHLHSPLVPRPSASRAVPPPAASPLPVSPRQAS